MKKLLLIAFILIGIFAEAQPGYTRINSRYNWLAGMFDAFNLPGVSTPALKTAQQPRAGAMVYDSTGGNIGVHVYTGSVWVRLADTTWSGGSQGLQSVITNDNVMTGDNVVSMGANDFTFQGNGAPDFKVADVSNVYLWGQLNLQDAASFVVTDTLSSKPAVIESTGNVKQFSSWAKMFSYATGGSGLTVGTTPITSGTGGRILYETSGNVLGETTTTSTGSNLLVNTTSATDPITGNAIFKAEDANGMVLSFRDHVSGQGYLSISNGTMTGYLGQTNATQGITTGSYTAHPVTIVQQNSPAMTFDVSKHVGVYTVTSPSALFHLPAGSASATYAPLKFTTGTLNTTAEAGTKEYNGTHYATKASGLRYASEGTIADFYTDVNNSGTGETDIYTYTTPASTLANDGEKVFFNYTLNLADITATATIKCYFAGTAIANTGALTVSATGAVIVTGWIIRTSSTTARASVNIASPTASTAVYTSQTDLTGLTLSGTNIVKVTAQAGGGTGGSNDIVGKSGTVSWRGVAAN